MPPEIDIVARGLAENVRQLLEHREDFMPVEASEFSRAHRAHYEVTQQELAAEGVMALADFEDLAVSRMSVLARSFIRVARSSDGEVAAQSFVAVELPPGEEELRFHACLVLHTWLEDGRVVITARGAKDNGCPNGPWRSIQILDDDASTREVVRRHRDQVRRAGGVPRRLGEADTIVAAIAADEEKERDFRRGLGTAIVEPILRKLTGDAFETQGRPILEAIQAHPEWLTEDDADPDEIDISGAVRALLGSEDATDPDEADEHQDGDRAPIAMFLSSQDAGRTHLTTMGMAFRGLPEMQMKGVAANHMRAARFLMNTVARKLVALDPSAVTDDFELPLTREDVSPDELYVTTGRFPEIEGEAAPARIRIVLETFAADEPDENATELLCLQPPRGESSTPDQWLRTTCRRLGQDAPAALDASSRQDQMRAASERARSQLADLSRRFSQRQPEAAVYLIKTPLPARSGGTEYVWTKIRDWQPDGTLVAELASQPHDCPPYRAGQELRLRESDVYDYAVHTPSGQGSEASRTDIVAQEFGLDL